MTVVSVKDMVMRAMRRQWPAMNLLGCQHYIKGDMEDDTYLGLSLDK